MSPKVGENYKEQRRRQILQAAKQVFTEKGFELATMKDVVEASGMSRGFVYSYFGSTEAMFRALMEQFDEEAPDPAEMFAGGEHAWDIVEKFITEDMLPKDKMLFVIYEYFTAGWRYPERQAYLEERYWKNRRYYMSILERGTAAGEFRPQAPIPAIAEMMISFVEGLLMSTVQLKEGTIDPEPQLALMRQLLKHLLQPNKGEKS